MGREGKVWRDGSRWGEKKRVKHDTTNGTLEKKKQKVITYAGEGCGGGRDRGVLPPSQ